MTNTSKVTALLADGKPRTLAQIARSARISKASADRALRQLRSAGDCVSRRQEILYVATDAGLSRFERQQAQIQEHNEQVAERVAEALSKAKAIAAVQAARSGAIPNSVFALARHA